MSIKNLLLTRNLTIIRGGCEQMHTLCTQARCPEASVENPADGCVVCASVLSKNNWTPKRSNHLCEAVVSWIVLYVEYSGMHCTNTKDTLLYRSAVHG